MRFGFTFFVVESCSFVIYNLNCNYIDWISILCFFFVTARRAASLFEVSIFLLAWWFRIITVHWCDELRSLLFIYVNCGANEQFSLCQFNLIMDAVICWHFFLIYKSHPKHTILDKLFTVNFDPYIDEWFTWKKTQKKSLIKWIFEFKRNKNNVCN